MTLTEPAASTTAESPREPLLIRAEGFEAVERTFAQMVQDRAQVEPDEVAFRQWDGTHAVPTTWAQYAAGARAAAVGLAALGVAPGDRVAIMSAGRAEWVVAALGVLSAGGLPVGVYPTSAAAEVRQLVAHSGAVALVVGDADDVAKVAAVAPDLPALRAVVSFDGAPEGLPAPVLRRSWADLCEEGRVRDTAEPALFQARLDGGHIDQPAALFYTSGSTGTPKGVVHTHRTLQFSILGAAILSPGLTGESLSFLGLSHVSPALSGVYAPIMTRLRVTFCRPDQLSEALRAVRPSGVVWPPRLHEKMLSGVLATAQASSGAVAEGYEAALAVSREVLALRWRGETVAAELQARYDRVQAQVFRPLRAKLGMDELKVAWTASGAMTPEVHTLWQLWGVDLRELYGTTETCGWVLAQWDRAFPPPGTIGKVIPDPRFAIRTSPEGELLVKGPSLFRGYWNDPQATAEAMDGEWYRTGDLAEISETGEVKLVGRAKDLIVTTGGKTISPQPLELRFAASPLVGDALVVGDGRKYLTALVWPSEEGARLAPEVLEAQLRTWLDEHNRDFARPLQIKDFRLAPRPPAPGELTAKGTLRRGPVLAAFAALVDEMYSAEEQDEFARQAALGG